MYILGLHTGHDASACLFKGNELVAFCKKERLNRVKMMVVFLTCSRSMRF